MKVSPHLVSLYVKTARRYKKLISKIHRETVSSYQRRNFIHQIKKLLKKLRDLETQLKMAAATGAVVLMLNASPVQAQSVTSNTLGPFNLQNRLKNPLREPIFTDEPILTIVDFDLDNDGDVVIGEFDDYGGKLRYFENKSSEGQPIYLELEGADNPFEGIYAETHRVAPAFADIDKDGDLDLFLGQNGSYVVYQYPYNSSRGIEYYRNDAGNYTKQTGTWNASTKQGNPFDAVEFGYHVNQVFVDFDKDGDLDLIAGSTVTTGTYPDYYTKYIHYYVNDGNGNFTSAPITLDTTPSYYSGDEIFPAPVDLDADGDFDLVIGNYYDGFLRYYKQETPGNFIEQTGDWDPGAKTGNPFDNLNVGLNASPVFIDFDKDGQPDLFVGDEEGYYDAKYSDNIINYYKNSGNAVFVEKDEFENPFDGVFVKDDAGPTLLDIDGDNDLDAVIGNKYQYTYYDDNTMQYVTVNSYLTHYKKNEEGFQKTSGDTNPVDALEVYGNFIPQFADVDGDNDLDIISGNFYGEVVYFRNDGGVYKNEIELSPFAGLNAPYYGAAKLADIDNDQDLDLFLTNYDGEIHYFENEGSAQAPVYTELFGDENPLDSAAALTSNTAYLNFADLDHDGDLDLLFNKTAPYYSAGIDAVVYIENTGTPENPVYEKNDEVLFSEVNSDARIFTVDYDGDGDLDVFGGNENGTVSYAENKNPAVATTVTSTVIVYEPGDDPIIVEPDLAIADPDDDPVIRATVSIGNFQSGEVLAFTPQEGISGTFNTDTGVLLFQGTATVEDYQALLRTVTFESAIAAGGRKKSTKSITPKNISFAVFDIDLTNPAEVSKTVNIFVNTPPEIQPDPGSSTSGLAHSINLMEITSDVDNNLDPDSFTIVQGPSSGAPASIVFVSSTEVTLLIDYEGIDFSGTDHLTIRACDESGACTEKVLSIEVTGEVIVYNAVAPNSSGDNKFLRITGLTKNNKVSIYNRWGDKVYDTDNYLNNPTGNAFKGMNNGGKPLASGTYFYTIEIPEKKKITGYLTLKQ